MAFVEKFILIDMLYKTQENQWACDASLPKWLPLFLCVPNRQILWISAPAPMGVTLTTVALPVICIHLRAEDKLKSVTEDINLEN